MSNPNYRLRWLFQRYQQNECSSEELKELLQLIAEDNNDSELLLLLDSAIAANASHVDVDVNKADQLFNEIIYEGKQALSEPVVKKMFPWRRIMAAASVLIIVGLGTYLWTSKKDQSVLQFSPENKTARQVLPGRNTAMLTLADGSTITLDSVANGPLAQQGSVQVIKLNDRITYGGSKAGATSGYNTLSTARGNQYQLELADGTKVWLNAASSIRFPVAFSGTERRVSITGEAYFEVAHNASVPFKVSVNEMEIAVLGTHFNVNAYSDEASINTTLLEGAVKLSAGKASKLLQPKQQAKLDGNGTFKIARNIDTDEVVAWKNGSFIFNEESIESIMRQISRWYDVDIIYQRRLNKETFSGIVSRQTALPQVLRILEAGGVQFQLQENKIIIQ